MIQEQIILDRLKKKDMAVMYNAVQFYIGQLQFDVQAINKAAHHIHQSIAFLLYLQLKKYFDKREQPESKKLKLEKHEAFVLKDALTYFEKCSEHDLERAIASRLIMQMYSFLPHVADYDIPSVDSKIN